MRPCLVVVLVAACGPSLKESAKPVDVASPTPHKAGVTALVQPMIDAAYTTGMVVGLYDGGKVEVYGFGRGPGNRAPDEKTLFEIGSVTKVFTSLMLADAVQRQEVTLATELSDLLPPGVTVPTRDHRTVTLGELAMHTSGLPRLPPSLGHQDPANPYAKYSQDVLYADLVQTQLVDAPGAKVLYSNYGAGVLGFALGRKLGLGYAGALQTRVLEPLGLGSTYLAVPEGAKYRRATGTNPDLAPVPYWYFDALAGAGALVSDAHDMLVLVQDELDAASGSKQTLRPAMRFTQEPGLDHPEGDNEGLGWQIDSAGRYWHNGQTGGFHSFVGFDPKTRRGVVILASTALQLLDRLPEELYKLLGGEETRTLHTPTADAMAQFAGTYSLGGEKLVISVKGTRMYITGRGAPPYRLVPINDHEMWIEELQSIVGFQRAGDKVLRAVFLVGDQQLAAARLDENGTPVVPPSPAPAPPVPVRPTSPPPTSPPPTISPPTSPPPTIPPPTIPPPKH